MNIGVINAEGKPIVPVVIAGGSGQEQKTPCLLATGFRGDIILPLEQAQALGLPQTGTERIAYPLPSQEEAPVFSADILWCGEARTARVLGYGRQPILGVGLLKGCRLSLRVRPGEPIVLERIV